MTLDEFRATGRDCDDLGAALSDGYWEEYSEPARGRLYLGHLWIERKPAAGWPQERPENWFLLLGREHWLSDDLSRLEALLYAYALGKRLIPA